MIIAAATATAHADTNNIADTISDIGKNIRPISIQESDQVNIDTLENRLDNYILIEKISGVCIDAAGNGRTSDGYYISYRNIPGDNSGHVFNTYCLYANSPYEDDIIYRNDIDITVGTNYAGY